MPASCWYYCCCCTVCVHDVPYLKKTKLASCLLPQQSCSRNSAVGRKKKITALLRDHALTRKSAVLHYLGYPYSAVPHYRGIYGEFLELCSTIVTRATKAPVPLYHTVRQIIVGETNVFVVFARRVHYTLLHYTQCRRSPAVTRPLPLFLYTIHNTQN